MRDIHSDIEIMRFSFINNEVLKNVNDYNDE